MPNSKPRARLLLVEDEAVIAMDLEARLRNLRYDVCAVASTAEEAVSLARSHLPQLVVMDIRLAGNRDGVEAAGDISESVGIPHIYLTSYTDRATLVRAKRTAPLGYLVKPFTDHDLHSTIQAALYRHRTERKLAEHREWRDSFFRRLGDAVVAVDEHGRVRFLNAAAETLTGLSGADAFGKPFTSVWPRHEADSAGTAGPPEQFITLVEDIAERTDRVTYLLAKARAECMARLAARIAHSFNEQLTVLATAATAPPDQVAAATRTLHALVAEMHTLAHPHAPNREPVDLNELVEDCTANVVRAVLPQGVEVDLECCPDEALTFVDRTQIEQALLDVVLTLRNRPDAAKIVSIRTGAINSGPGAPQEQIGIWITDTDIDTLLLKTGPSWNPASHQSAGAGLEEQTADELVRQNGGTVERLTGNHHGVAFRILLPRFRTRTETPRAKAAPARHSGQTRVLVVDDSQQIRAVVRAVLEPDGYQVLEAGSAEDALAMLAGREAGIDVLLSDVVLPGLSGADLGVRLARENPALSVVLMSGYTEDQLSMIRTRIENSTFLPKPFAPDELINALTRPASATLRI